MCPVVKFDKSLDTILCLCPINSFKIPVQVYFMLDTHQTVSLSLHRTDISLNRGENGSCSHSLWNHYNIASDELISNIFPNFCILVAIINKSN